MLRSVLWYTLLHACQIAPGLGALSVVPVNCKQAYLGCVDRERISALQRQPYWLLLFSARYILRTTVKVASPEHQIYQVEGEMSLLPLQVRLRIALQLALLRQLPPWLVLPLHCKQQHWQHTHES